MSDLFDAPVTGAPRAGGVSVADAAPRDDEGDATRHALAGAGVMVGIPDHEASGFARGVAAVPAAGVPAKGQGWAAGLPPKRPAGADPEEDDADDLDDDVDDDEDDEDDLDDLDDDEDDDDEDDDFDDDDEDLDDDDDDDLVDLDDEYDNDDDDDRTPVRPDYESE